MSSLIDRVFARLVPSQTLASRYVRLALVLGVVHCLAFLLLQAALLSAQSQTAQLLTVHKTEVAIALIRNQSQLSADSIIRRARALLFYSVLFIVALLFQFVLLIDAIRNKNTIQIIGLYLFHVLTLGYSIMQVLQTRNIIASDLISAQLHDMVPDYSPTATLPLSITIVALMAISVLVVWSYTTYKLFQEFGWQIFKQIGADLRMRKMYMIYQIFITILKFDVFMLLAFSTQWLIMLVDQAETPGSSSYGDFSQVVIHSIVSVGGSVAMLILAYWAVRTERKWAMCIFIVADLATVGYFISKLVFMQPPYVTIGVQCIPGWPPESCDRYDGSRNFFTLFLSVDIILGLVTAAIAVKALLNFDRGLLPHVDLRKRKGGWFNCTNGDVPMSDLEAQPSKRWTID